MYKYNDDRQSSSHIFIASLLLFPMSYDYHDQFLELHCLNRAAWCLEICYCNMDVLYF